LSERLRSAESLHRRLIQRATYIYAALQFQSVEPEALRERNARGMVLERLARAYLGGPAQAWPLLFAEQQALVRLDVPIFETDLRGRRTQWLDGQLADWPGDDALAGVLARLATLNEDDMRWQAKLIRSAIAARHFTPDVGGSLHPQTPVAPLPPEATVTLAERVGAQVVGDALRVEGAATWMTLALLSDGAHANVQRIGTGLYDGILGVAAYLYESGNSGLADAAMTPLFDELISGDPARVRRQLLATGVGWSGAGGYLRALRWLQGNGHLDPERADAAVGAVVDSLGPRMLAQDRWLDVMNGTAGLIVPLAAEIAARLASERNTDHAGSAGRHHLERLLAAAADHLITHQQDNGGWITLPGRAPLTGYAHGAAGIALALVVAYLALDEPRYLDAAMRALAYEAGSFDATAGNWPDFRETAQSGFMLGWCAGAPGIALTRMRLLQLLPDHPATAQWERELEVGAHTTAEVGLLERDHVCCGNFARVAILETLGVEYQHDDWLAAAGRLRQQIVQRAGAGLPRPFLGFSEYSAASSRDTGSRAVDDPGAGVLAVPGLMTGLAGQGLLLGNTEPAATHAWVSALLL
jgi:lantibiotic modifying enzyme